MEREIKGHYLEKLKAYYENEARKLYGMVDKILLKFGGLSNKDVDYFYCVASDLFADICLNDRYDPSKGDFEPFLYSCLSNKIKTEMTSRNCEKRRADRTAVSIDMPVGDEEGSTIGDTLADHFTIEKELFERQETGYSKRMRLYLGRLSGLQKKVLNLNIAGYLPNEIKEELHISEKQYADCYTAIHSYKNVSVLF